MLQVAGTQADSLRRALDATFASPDYRWADESDPIAPLRRAWAALQDFVFQLQSGNPDLYRLLKWALVAILLLVLAHAAWITLRTVRAGSAASSRDPVLPPPRVHDAAWYRVEAARLAREHRYVEAMQADFLRLVLELDARRVMRFHPSTTPIEYVRSASVNDSRREELRELVRAMYAHAFARIPCDLAEYESWHRRAEAERYAPAH